MKIEVRFTRGVRSWARWGKVQELPVGLREAIFQNTRLEEDAGIWIDASSLMMPVPDVCPLCEARPPAASFGLCADCFGMLSVLFLRNGLIFVLPDKTIEAAPRWLKFLSRFRRNMIWVGSGTMYGITIGREIELLDTLNRVLKLHDRDKLTPESLRWSTPGDTPSE